MKPAPSTKFRHPSGHAPAFSLIELLLVVAVMGLLAALTLPAFNSMGRSMSLTSGGQQIADAFTLARQQAVSKSRKAEVRLIQLPDDHGQNTQVYRAVQVYIAKGDATNMVPVNKLARLPTGIIVTDRSTRSPILSNPAAGTGTVPVGGVNRTYTAFTLQADGGLAGTYSGGGSFLTVEGERDAQGTDGPANFSTIYINPITGQVTIFRP